MIKTCALFKPFVTLNALERYSITLLIFCFIFAVPGCKNTQNDALDEENAKKMGIREFVTKPVVIKTLAQVVRRVLDDKDGS